MFMFSYNYTFSGPCSCSCSCTLSCSCSFYFPCSGFVLVHDYSRALVRVHVYVHVSVHIHVHVHGYAHVRFLSMFMFMFTFMNESGVNAKNSSTHTRCAVADVQFPFQESQFCKDIQGLCVFVTDSSGLEAEKADICIFRTWRTSVSLLCNHSFSFPSNVVYIYIYTG
jgi:hypothetical protein